MNNIIAEQYIMLLENKVQEWQSYLDIIPMLKVGVDILKQIESIGVNRSSLKYFTEKYGKEDLRCYR